MKGVKKRATPDESQPWTCTRQQVEMVAYLLYPYLSDQDPAGSRCSSWCESLMRVGLLAWEIGIRKRQTVEKRFCQAKTCHQPAYHCCYAGAVCCCCISKHAPSSCYLKFLLPGETPSIHRVFWKENHTTCSCRKHVFEGVTIRYGPCIDCVPNLREFVVQQGLRFFCVLFGLITISTHQTFDTLRLLDPSITIELQSGHTVAIKSGHITFFVPIQNGDPIIMESRLTYTLTTSRIRNNTNFFRAFRFIFGWNENKRHYDFPEWPTEWLTLV